MSLTPPHEVTEKTFLLISQYAHFEPHAQSTKAWSKSCSDFQLHLTYLDHKGTIPIQAFCALLQVCQWWRFPCSLKGNWTGLCIFPDAKKFPSNWKWIKEWSRCQHLVQNRFECNFRSESLYLFYTADFAAIQHQSWKRDLLLWCKSNSLPMQMQMQYEVQVKFCTASHQSQSVGGAVQRRSEINPMIQPGPKSPTTCPKLHASPTFWHNFHCSVKVTSYYCFS